MASSSVQGARSGCVYLLTSFCAWTKRLTRFFRVEQISFQLFDWRLKKVSRFWPQLLLGSMMGRVFKKSAQCF